ncbi:MAG: hypothetical protein AB8B55_21735 [Mariniblastus sp.]
MQKLLKEDFIPVAIDQWYERRQKDTKGDFYRKIASQGPRNDFEHTTQGRYVCDATGKLYAYNNNRGYERILKSMKEALAKFDPEKSAAKKIEAESTDPKYNFTAPKNGLVLRVNSKVLDGYKPTEGWKEVFQRSIGRDNAWITEEEKKQLANVVRDGGDIPTKLAQRIARFHLIDNTRGEPPRWTVEEVKSLKISVDKKGIVKGSVHLETADGKRGFQTKIYGHAKADGETIAQFDLVAKGEFWGRGQYTGFAPEGKFPLAIAFRIADGTDLADSVVPHGAKGWLDGYYQ